jgi:hypothetical protein
VVDPNRPASHLGDERDRGRRTAHRAPAGQDKDRRRVDTARGCRAHPDRGSDDTATGKTGHSPRVFGPRGSAPIDRPWRKIAKAIHGHGIPTITLDPVSTPYEIACQVVLKGYWHGYIGSEEPALANAVAMAYPRQVERIQRATRAPNRASAAATLLEQLIHPGFDPAQGAEATPSVRAP